MINIYNCPICNLPVTRFKGLINHCHETHIGLSDEEFISKFRNEDIKLCKIPGCNNICEIDYRHLIFYSLCNFHREKYPGSSGSGVIAKLNHADKRCPICNNYYSNLWNHFWNDHQNSKLTNSEFLKLYLNLSEVPKCKNETCNNDCMILFKNINLVNIVVDHAYQVMHVILN